MPSLNVTVDDDRAIARLDRVAPDARAALKSALADLADTVAADARARAQSHIRFFGAKAPGAYVESIHGGVAEKDHAIIGYVRSGHPLAHLMELGTKAHDIFPKPGDILAFEGDAGTVFARHVHSPGTQAYPAILPAFEAARDDIATALEDAVKKGTPE